MNRPTSLGVPIATRDDLPPGVAAVFMRDGEVAGVIREADVIPGPETITAWFAQPPVVGPELPGEREDREERERIERMAASGVFLVEVEGGRDARSYRVTVRAPVATNTIESLSRKDVAPWCKSEPEELTAVSLSEAMKRLGRWL